MTCFIDKNDYAIPSSHPHSVVMVVGAGRGPLVDASLHAAQSVERKIRIYAVEKNPGAVIT